MMSENAATAAALQPQRANPWMFRYAVGLVVCLIVLIVLGAAVTSEIQPIPGGIAPPAPTSGTIEPFLEHVHMIAAITVTALIFGFAVWHQMRAHSECVVRVRATDRSARLNLLGWAAVLVAIAECLWGIEGSHSPAGGFFHALGAQVLLSMVVVLAVGVLPHPELQDLVQDTCRIPLRTLAVVTPSLTLLQVLLGAAYRHGILGVMLHILNALIVAIAVLVACMLTTRQFPDHGGLRRAAVAFAVITGIQLALGFATFTLLLIGLENLTPLLVLSVAHVTTGALTLAASFLFAAQIWRYVQRLAEVATVPVAEGA
jgi:heme A synthase